MTLNNELEVLERQFERIYQRIEAACISSGRSKDDVTLVAVCKNQPVWKIQSYIDFCKTTNRTAVLAENYVQEWEGKKSSLTGDYTCHLIGHLQSNKSKLAVSIFDHIQTIDSLKLVETLSKESNLTGKIMKVWVQVNISDDQAKYGVSPLESYGLVEAILATSLEFSGLMTITKIYEQPISAKADFCALKEVADQLRLKVGLARVGLSMGMSDDFEVAISAGATCVRVGSALFGVRN